MKGTIFERRRAERFAQLLDEADGGRRRHIRQGADDDLAPMVALSHRVTSVPVPVEPDQEFRVGLRAMLMATMEREGIGATAVDDGRQSPAAVVEVPPVARRSRARIAVLIGVTAGALTVSGVSAASGDAMPGDPLYPIKRNSERAQLALAGSDVSRGNLYLEFARTRLGEAGRVSPDRVPAVLADMDQQSREGVRRLTTTAVDRRDAAALAIVEGFVARQREMLVTILPTLDGAGQGRVAESAQLLNDIANRAAGLRADIACGGTGGKLDSLGPVPLGCRPDEPVGNRPRKAPAGPASETGKVDSATEPTPGGGETPVSAGPSRAPDAPAGPTSAPVAPSAAPAEPADGDVLDDVGQVLGDLLG